jgi:translation initiation factor IF-2
MAPRDRALLLLVRGWRERLSSASAHHQQHQHHQHLKQQHRIHAAASAPPLLLCARATAFGGGNGIAAAATAPPRAGLAAAAIAQQKQHLLSTSAAAHQKPHEKQQGQQQQQNRKQQASLPPLSDLLGGRGGGGGGGGDKAGKKQPQPRAKTGGNNNNHQRRDPRLHRLVDQKQRERDVQHARAQAEDTNALLAERLRETEGSGGAGAGGGNNNARSSTNSGRRASGNNNSNNNAKAPGRHRESPKEIAERRKREAAAQRAQTRAAAAQQVAGRWASRLEKLQRQQGQGAAAALSSASDDDEEEAADDADQALQQQASVENDTTTSSQSQQQLREVVLSASDLGGASSGGQGQLTARRLAALLGCSSARVERALADLGEPVKSEEDPVALDAAELAALELGAALILPGDGGEAGGAAAASRSSSTSSLEILEPRPPVVTVMGHVDHGKTSLLDALRRTDVAAGEAGGITQRIGAFSVELPGSSRRLTFLDTPGHAAFGAMRARGAAVTDVVVLVVAADDGVMPQTAEALAHARAAGCPVVVAVTKCDLVPPSRVEQVKAQLASELSLELEAFGGTVQCVETAVVPASKGKKGEKGESKGLRELEEALLLQAEVMELKAARRQRVVGAAATAGADDGSGDANTKTVRVRASGTVVEAHVERGMGPVATVVVQRGELRVGDVVVCGTAFGRVRALRGGHGGLSSGDADASVGPGEHALVSGLRSLPSAGDELAVVADEDRAARIARARQARAQEYGRVALARARHSAEARRRAAAAAEAARKKALSARLNELRAVKRHQVGELKKALADFAALRNSGGGGGASGGDVAAGDEQDDDDAAEPAADDNDASAAATASEDQDQGPLPDAPVVPFIIKADVQGSAEAVRDAVLALPRRGTAAASVVLCGVGPASLSDAHLAAATGARLLAFNVRPASGDVEAAIRSARVRVLEHDVIYRLLDDVRELLEREGGGGGEGGGDGASSGAFDGSSSPGEREVVVGSGTVLQIFPLLRKGKNVGTVAGLGVDSGSLVRSDAAGSAAAAAAAGAALNNNAAKGAGLPPGTQVVRVEYRVLRDGEVIAAGLPCSDLRRQKLDVESVGKGAQCGAALDGGNWGGNASGGPKPGDVLECVAIVRSSASSSKS